MANGFLDIQPNQFEVGDKVEILVGKEQGRIGTVSRVDYDGYGGSVTIPDHRMPLGYMNHELRKIPKETDEPTYIVRLTEAQIKLVRKTIGERAHLVKNWPLSDDGDLAQKLFDLDKPFHAVSSSL